MTDILPSIYERIAYKNVQATQEFLQNFNSIEVEEEANDQQKEQPYNQYNDTENYDKYKQVQFYDSQNPIQSGLGMQGAIESKQKQAMQDLINNWEQIDAEDQQIKNKTDNADNQQELDPQKYHNQYCKKHNNQVNNNHAIHMVSQNHKIGQQNNEQDLNPERDIQNKIKKVIKTQNSIASRKNHFQSIQVKQENQYYQDQKVIASNKIQRKSTQNKLQQQIPNSEKIERKDKMKSTRIYKIEKDSIRKHSQKKQKQAQYQMMANLQFLKSMRGSVESGRLKKEWKQEKLQSNNLLQSLKNSKKQKIQSLGFSIDNNSNLLQKSNSQIKMSTMDVYALNNSRHILPQLKHSRKKGQIFKPAAFSVYTIQKSNQVYYNNYPK